MMKNESLRCTLEEVQSLVRSYASYVQCKGGLGHVLGGIMLLLVTLFAARLPPGLPAIFFTCSLFLTWLVSKEVLRKLLYMSFGEVRAVRSRGARFFHLLRAGPGSLLVVGISFFIAAHYPLTLIQRSLLMALLLTIPALSWFLLRSLSEWLSGMALLIFCLLCSFGYLKIPSQLFVLALLLASLLIALGLTEHFQFRELAARLRARQQEQFSLFFFVPMLFFLALCSSLSVLYFPMLAFQSPLSAALIVLGCMKLRHTAWKPRLALAYHMARHEPGYCSWKGF